MISKLFTITFAVVVAAVSLVSAQLPEQFPAGVDPAKCPNFPICDNAFLHNSQAVPRTFPSEGSVGGGQHHYHQQPQPQHQPQHQPQYQPQPQHQPQQNHYQSPQQQYSPSPPKHQWVSAAEPQQHHHHQSSSVPVSHRNTALPSSSFGPVPAPAHIPGSYQPIQHQHQHQSSSGHESGNSQWTLKNLRFDSGDYYQAPQSNHLPEQNHYNPPPQQQQHQQQSQHQFQYQPQSQHHQQQQYQPQPQHQQQHYVPEQNRNYSPESDDSSSHNVGKTPPGGDKYPAGVDASSCPNYPYCGATPTGQEGPGHVGPGHAASAPLPGFTERQYPAGVNPQQCANFPYCFE